MVPRIVGLCALLAALALAGCARKDKARDLDAKPQDKDKVGKPGHDPARPKAAVYKTPQECFDAYSTSEAKGDHKTYIDCLSPEAQKERIVIALIFFQPRPKDKKTPEEEKFSKELGTVMSRHGLSEKLFEEDDDPKKAGKSSQAALAQIKDHTAFLVDFMAAMDRSGMDFKEEEKSKPKLTGLKVSGDRATATVVRDTQRGERKTPLGFIKVGESWRVAGMDEVKLEAPEYEGPKKDGPKKDGPKKALGKPDFKTTADALTKELMDDKKAFDKKYKGKVIEVEGIVYQASKFFSDSAISLLGVIPNPEIPDPYTVRCDGFGPTDKAWRLGKGQKVKVIGHCDGSNFIFTRAVVLTDCVVTPLDTDQTRQVTAKELAGEVVKDEDAAKKKYFGTAKEVELIVEGTVSDLQNRRDLSFAGSSSHVFLVGADKYPVACQVKKAEFDALKKGDKVKLKGLCRIDAFDKREKQLVLQAGFVLEKD